MITDINSLVSGQGNSSSPQTATTSSIGALAKLSSELKLIDGLHPIQITSVKTAQSGTQTSQMIGITRSDQKQYTLISDNTLSNVSAGDKGTLTVKGNQITLSVPVSQSSQQTNVSQTTGQYASTVTSNTQPTTGNQTNSTSAQAFTATQTQASASNSAAITSNAQANKTALNTTQADAQQTSKLSNNYAQPSQQSNTSSLTTQQAQVSAKVAIASSPITLTVISSQSSVAENAVTATSQKPVNSMTPSSGNASTTSNLSSLNTTLSPSATAASVNNSQYTNVVSDGKNQFTLITQHPLKTGETLSVIVDKQGQIQLYPKEPTNPVQETLTDGLKQSLPKQISAQELVNTVRQLTQLAQSGQPMPEKLSAALDQLIKQIPNIQNLTQSSDALKLAIQTSGVFSEQNLLNKTNIESDFKLNLTRVDNAANEVNKAQSNSAAQPLASLNSNHQQALNMVAGAIERITTSQVKNLVENAQQDGSVLPLNIEIPVKDGQSTSLVNVRIDQDRANNQDSEPHNRRWLIQLKFDFEETGKFEARASVQNKKVGILFAVEEPETEQAIRQNLNDLRSSLRSKQIEIETLDCFRAKLNSKPSSSAYETPSQTRLIDVRT